MTIRYLRIFVAIYETQSTTKASEQLHIAQPSISLALKEMEDYYGIKFFDRVAKRLHVTEAGQTLYRYAKDILHTFEEMEIQLKKCAAPEAIRIGTSINIGSLLLPGYIKTFEQSCPNTKVRAIIDSNPRIIEAVLNHEVDFALVESSLNNPRICQFPFMQDPLLFICGRSHPLYHTESIPPEDLEKYNFIVRNTGTVSRDILSREPLSNLKIKIIMESANNEAVINAVKAGLGLSVQPLLQVESAIRTGDIHSIQVEGLSYTRNLYLLYHKGHKLETPEKMFIHINCHMDPDL